MKFNRAFLVKTHMTVAAFIFPVVMMFCITGALYSWGIKGGYHVQKFKLELAQPMQRDKLWLTQLVKQELMQREITLPTGKASIKGPGKFYYFVWTGSQLDVELEQTNNPFVAQLKIKQTNLHRFFVQLHKAKGGIAFKVYAVIAATGLILLFLTGFLMAWKLKKERLHLLLSATMGLGLFITMLLTS
ncbi:MAG: PepSY domain-containing protein [Methyloprofundus sp.]|nr:PepSY domain-containing protein [Methyloprofundus sp.]